MSPDWIMTGTRIKHRFRFRQGWLIYKDRKKTYQLRLGITPNNIRLNRSKFDDVLHRASPLGTTVRWSGQFSYFTEKGKIGYT